MSDEEAARWFRSVTLRLRLPTTNTPEHPVHIAAARDSRDATRLWDGLAADGVPAGERAAAVRALLVDRGREDWLARIKPGVRAV